MAAFNDETRQYHIERVKEVLVLKPTASAESVVRALEGSTDPLKLDRAYARKLMKKIREERHHRFNREIVQVRLAEIQDKTQLVGEQMWKIFLDPKADDKARVQAGKAIIENEHKFLEAQMNAGIFDRKLGTLAVDHDHIHAHVVSLAPEMKEPILRALANYGLIRNAKYKLTPAPTPAAESTHGGGTTG